MSTITLPNIRVSSDLTVRVRLKDGGVAIDWSTLNNIKASIYSDAQRALAGRCGVSIDAEDSTLLVCSYAANKPQYVGVNRIVVSAKYMGETKTYDKPAFNFVRWTADQEGEQITIDDPDVDVEIDVEDISSSILQEAVEAAFEAADRANDAAAAAEHMVDIHTGPEGKSAYEVAVEEGYVGTEEEWLASLVGPQGPQGIQGETGEAAGFGTASASLTEDGGNPGVTVSASGSDTAKNFAFTFKNLKGDKGDKGDQGNTGSSVDYPYELVNNLTTDDATKGLAASQGVALAGEVSQLEAKVTEMQIPVKYPNGYITTSGAIGSYVDVNSPIINAAWKSYLASCKSGDTAIVSGTGGGSPRLWAFLDNEYKILSQSAASVSEDGLVLTAPANAAWIVVNDNSGKLSYLKVDANLTDIERRLETQEAISDEILPKVTEFDILKITEKYSGNLADMDTMAIGYTISDAGLVQGGFADSYIVTDYIPVKGQNISGNTWAGSASYSIGNVYDSDFNLLRTLGNGVSKYTYQNGDAYVRLCLRNLSNDLPRAFYGDVVKPYEKATPIGGYMPDLTYTNPFVNIHDENACNRVLELFLVGLDMAKEYTLQNVDTYVSGDYKETRAFLYDGETRVARFYVLQNGFSGLAEINEYNDSGIYGYGVFNIKANENIPLNTIINNVAVSNLDFSPTIRNYIYQNTADLSSSNKTTNVRAIFLNGITIGTSSPFILQNSTDYAVISTGIKKGDVCVITAPAGTSSSYVIPSYVIIADDGTVVDYSVQAQNGKTIFAPVDGVLYVTGGQGNISLIKSNSLPNKYIVSKTGAGYSSLLQCVLEATKYFDSEVYVQDGEYDLETEFKAVYGASFFDNFAASSKVLGIHLKNRVRLVFSSNSKVVFNYTGNNQYVKSLFSPFNADLNGFSLENATIEASNCRYCVHDELASRFTPYHNTYKNCKMRLDNTQNDAWASSQCIGGGLGVSGSITIDSCQFTSLSGGVSVSYHNNGTAEQNGKSSILIKDSYFADGTGILMLYYGDSTKVTPVYVCGNSLGAATRLEPQGGASVVNMEVIGWNNEVRS